MDTPKGSLDNLMTQETCSDFDFRLVLYTYPLWIYPKLSVFYTESTKYHNGAYSLNKKEWICSLFKEWILEKSEIRVNLEWIRSEHFVLFTHFGVTTGITQGFRVIPEVTPKWVNNTNVHSKFTLISLFSKIHSLKSEHIHSFLFREYCDKAGHLFGTFFCLL